MGAPVAGSELQRHVLAARRHDAGAYSARRAGFQAPRAREPRQRSRQRVAYARGGQGLLSAAEHWRHPLSGTRRRAAAPGRHRAPRRDGLGIRARGGCARGRHHRELRSDRHPPQRQRRGGGRGDHAWHDPRPARRRGGGGAPGNTSVIMNRAGIDLPLESYPLQALVSEPVKPVFPCVVMSNTIHAYISQSDKGELVIGAGTDAYTSYTQRGGLHITSHALEAICELFPMFRRLRMLRAWGGIVDVTPDRSPIIAKTPIPGLYVNCGWGTGGFKATPGSAHVFAPPIARDEPHPINAPFTIERFRDGHLIDEAAAAAVAH